MNIDQRVLSSLRAAGGLRKSLKRQAGRSFGEAQPRIHGELLKLGINISEKTVSRLMPKNRMPPSQTWRTFLDNHCRELVSIDFLTVPTATFRMLYGVSCISARFRRFLSLQSKVTLAVLRRNLIWRAG
jgi:hypothetical protein